MSEARGTSTDILIVPAGPGDAADLARVHVAAWRQTYEGLLPPPYLARMSEAAHARRFSQALLHPRPDDVILAAANRRGLVGYVAGGPARGGPRGEAEVSTLYLLRSAQGQGVGRRLLEDAARAMAARGAVSLRINVLAANQRARDFYAHLGGHAGPPKLERGPGGLMDEVTYRWPDISAISVR